MRSFSARSPRSRGVAALLVLLCAGVATRAQQPHPPASSDPAALVARERIRSTLERSFDLVFARSEDREANREDIEAAVAQVEALGEPAVEFLIPEIGSTVLDRSLFAAYGLARLGSAEGVAALRRAIEIADGEPRTLGARRKAWFAYCLAIAGEADAVDLLDSGKLPSAHVEISRELLALDATSWLTAPASVPRLLDQLERYRDDDETLFPRRALVLRALRHVAGPSIVPRVLPLVDDESVPVRVEALKALGAVGGKKAVDRLIAALDDPVPQVRFAAAQGLELLQPQRALKPMLVRLELEPETYVRNTLYVTVADMMGERALPVLRNHMKSTNYLDRRAVFEAFGRTGSARAVNLLREGLRDSNNTVRIQSLASLNWIGSPGAIESLLLTLRDSRSPVRQVAIEMLGYRRERRAGPRVAHSLLNELLPTYVPDGETRTQVLKQAELLVDVRYVEALPELRAAAERMTDPPTAETLRRAVARLTEIEARGDDSEKWTAALEAEDEDLRRLAYARLAEIGDASALRALTAAFDRADAGDQERILVHLGRAGAPAAAAPLVERVLSDPAFDLRTRTHVREAAAWVARRIGGSGMQRALRESALRRQGRDYQVLVYLALLAGRDALPTLREVLVPRLRHQTWDRGLEQSRLDWIVRRLAAGLDIGVLDADPERLRFQG